MPSFRSGARGSDWAVFITVAIAAIDSAARRAIAMNVLFTVGTIVEYIGILGKIN